MSDIFGDFQSVREGAASPYSSLNARLDGKMEIENINHSPSALQLPKLDINLSNVTPEISKKSKQIKSPLAQAKQALKNSGSRKSLVDEQTYTTI